MGEWYRRRCHEAALQVESFPQDIPTTRLLTITLITANPAQTNITPNQINNGRAKLFS